MISPHSKRSSAFQLQLGFCPTHQIIWSHLLQPCSYVLAAFHFLEYSLPPPGVLRERSQSDIWTVGQSLSCVPIFATPWTAALQASLSFSISWSLLKLMSISRWCHLSISALSPASPPDLNLSQHQGLFQWVSSSYQVAKELELQLQHQSFQWIFRVDFL